MVFTVLELKRVQSAVEPVILNAGQQIKNAWSNIHKIEYKDKRDIVTDVDVTVENYLRAKLTEVLPEAGFIVEEGKTDRKEKYNWVIDPIDGTKSFNDLLPMFLTQVALLDGESPVLGTIYNPISNQLFSASLNNGVTLNGKRITAQTQSDIDKSILSINFSDFKNNYELKIKIFSLLAKKCYRIRMGYGFLMSYLTTAAIDAVLFFNNDDLNKQYTDLTPNIIIVKEAGLKAEFITVNGQSIFLAANNKLFSYLSSLLKQI